MSTLEGREATALVVVDMQVGVMADSVRSDEVVDTIAGLVDRARSQEVPVVWVQHSNAGLVRDSEAWQVVPELPAADGEPVVHKTHGDAFEGTDLEDVLAGLRVGRLVVAGAQTDFCVRSTIHGGFARGYDVVLVGDAHTTEDLSEHGAPAPEAVVAHTNLYWAGQSGAGKTAAVASAADVVLAP